MFKFNVDIIREPYLKGKANQNALEPLYQIVHCHVCLS